MINASWGPIKWAVWVLLLTWLCEFLPFLFANFSDIYPLPYTQWIEAGMNAKTQLVVSCALAASVLVDIITSLPKNVSKTLLNLSWGLFCTNLVFSIIFSLAVKQGYSANLKLTAFVLLVTLVISFFTRSQVIQHNYSRR